MPTKLYPKGHQIPGTSSSKSLPTFTKRVWNFLELVRLKIALPLAQYKIKGRCNCIGCNANVSIVKSSIA